jgi:hypothetical protein
LGCWRERFPQVSGHLQAKKIWPNGTGTPIKSHAVHVAPHSPTKATMPSMNVSVTPPAAAPAPVARTAAPRDADGDNDGTGSVPAAAAPRAPALAAPGQPGSVLHVVA